jgi:hypothetical protein
MFSSAPVTICVGVVDRMESIRSGPAFVWGPRKEKHVVIAMSINSIKCKGYPTVRLETFRSDGGRLLSIIPHLTLLNLSSSSYKKVFNLQDRLVAKILSEGGCGVGWIRVGPQDVGACSLYSMHDIYIPTETTFCIPGITTLLHGGAGVNPLFMCGQQRTYPKLLALPAT